MQVAPGTAEPFVWLGEAPEMRLARHADSKRTPNHRKEKIMTDTPEDSTAPLADLDWEKIGRAVVMLVPTTVGLRHASLDSTLRDYIHPEPLSELDFVRDLFILPLDEVIEKWYGDRLAAGRMAADVMDQVLDELMPGGMDAFLARVREAAAARDKS